MLQKFCAAGMSGGSAALLCNPLDLIKVRMQAAGMRASIADVPNYRGVADATKSIVRQEGFAGLYKGVAPTVTRAMVVAAAQIASYDEIKGSFLRRGIQDGIFLHLTTAMLSGFAATAASSPFDVIRSRLMTQPVDNSGAGVLYRGPIDCFRKSFQSEGMCFGWRGFWPNYMCKGPAVVLLFLLYEQIQKHGDKWMDNATMG